jgi:telomerase reverse transcriptase
MLDVLNRYKLEHDPQITTEVAASLQRPSDHNTIHVMMYMFPRQFGLHNVFTSEVDHRQTVQPFKDYTLREDEINVKYSAGTQRKIPKRLRAKAFDLVRKLQVQHQQCAYKKLLEYYCPVSNM